MKFNLFKTKIPAFGMQINATNLKYLELTPAGSSVRIRSYAHVDLPKGMVSQDTISNADGSQRMFAFDLEKDL
jgi:Tfp pilus assembly PilM family ATPase